MFLYRNLAERCKRLAVVILDSCESPNEVRLLLQEEAAARKFFKHVFLYRYPQLTLAVEHKHKEFVTHPYCQQAVMRDFMGGMNWKDSSFTYKWSYYFMVILLMPFHILIYDIFRLPRTHMQIFHGSSDENDFEDEEMTKTQRLLKYLDNTKVVLDTPFNRFIAYTVLYQLFLGQLIYTALTPVSSQIKPIGYHHVLIFLWSFGHLITDIQCLGNGSWTIFATFWRLYHSFSNSLLNIGFALKVAIALWYHETEVIDELELISNICYAIATITTVVGILYWLQLHKKMGPIIIQLSHIITEVGTILTIWAIVLQAFTFGLFFLMFGSMKNFTLEHSSQSYGFIMSMLFWQLLNPGPPDMSGFEPQSENDTSGADGNGTYETNEIENEATATVRGMFTFWTIAVYQIVSAILILNLLIAALNTTIAKLETCKEMNYKYYATRYVPGSNIYIHIET